jgi:hypothetical protein
VSDFKKLDVWRKGHALVLNVQRTTARMRKGERIRAVSWILPQLQLRAGIPLDPGERSQRNQPNGF